MSYCFHRNVLCWKSSLKAGRFWQPLANDSLHSRERCMVKQLLNASSALAIWDNGFDISMSDLLRFTASRCLGKQDLVWEQNSGAPQSFCHPIPPSVPKDEAKRRHSALMYIYYYGICHWMSLTYCIGVLEDIQVRKRAAHQACFTFKII